jgi:hypothetical protein
MDKKQTQWILNLARPHGQDANDPSIAEVLSQLTGKPDRREWFESQQAADRQVAAALRATPVPAHLREAILTGARMQQENRATLWKRLVPFALAATVVFLAASTLLFSGGTNRSSSLASYQTWVSAFVRQTDFHLERETSNPAEILSWLTEHGIASPGTLPKGLVGLPTIGCRILPWNGQKISLMCFHLPNGGEAHLFVLSQALPGAPDQVPLFQRANDWSSAVWKDAGHTYVLASTVDEKNLRRLF